MQRKGMANSTQESGCSQVSQLKKPDNLPQFFSYISRITPREDGYLHTRQSNLRTPGTNQSTCGCSQVSQLESLTTCLALFCSFRSIASIFFCVSFLHLAFAENLK